MMMSITPNWRQARPESSRNVALAVHRAPRRCRKVRPPRRARAAARASLCGGRRGPPGGSRRPAAMPRAAGRAAARRRCDRFRRKAIPCWCESSLPPAYARDALRRLQPVLGGGCDVLLGPEHADGPWRRPVSRRPGHGAPTSPSLRGCGTPRRSAAPAEGGLHRREHARPVFRVDECLPAPGPFGEVRGALVRLDAEDTPAFLERTTRFAAKSRSSSRDARRAALLRAAARSRAGRAGR